MDHFLIQPLVERESVTILKHSVQDSLNSFNFPEVSPKLPRMPDKFICKKH